MALLFSQLISKQGNFADQSQRVIGKLLGLFDVPDYLANDISFANAAELSTVYAVIVGPHHVDLVSIWRRTADPFYHCPIHFMPESDDISAPGSAKEIGDFGHEHKIPILVRRF